MSNAESAGLLLVQLALQFWGLGWCDRVQAVFITQRQDTYTYLQHTSHLLLLA